MDQIEILNKINDSLVEIKIEQARQGEHISQNTKDLAEHILGVKLNRGRIEVLERWFCEWKGLVKAFKILISIVSILGIIAGIIFGILRFY